MSRSRHRRRILEMYIACCSGGTFSLRSAVRPHITAVSSASASGSVAIVSMKSVANRWLPGKAVTRCTRQLSGSSLTLASSLTGGGELGATVRPGADRRERLRRGCYREDCQQTEEDSAWTGAIDIPNRHKHPRRSNPLSNLVAAAGNRQQCGGTLLNRYLEQRGIPFRELILDGSRVCPYRRPYDEDAHSSDDR